MEYTQSQLEATHHQPEDENEATQKILQQSVMRDEQNFCNL
jgi:hypothetical protein